LTEAKSAGLKKGITLRTRTKDFDVPLEKKTSDEMKFGSVKPEMIAM
jgi:hypothetical protein